MGSFSTVDGAGVCLNLKKADAKQFVGVVQIKEDCNDQRTTKLVRLQSGEDIKQIPCHSLDNADHITILDIDYTYKQ